jgi:hypothetical protein
MTWMGAHKGFIWALVGLFAVLWVAYICSAFGIHPVTAAVPHYRRIWVFFLLLMALFLVGMGFLAVQLFLHPIIKNVSITQVVIAVAALFGLVYMFVLPPMSAPDEIRHYLTAYKLSNQMMGKTAVDEEGHVYMRAEDADLLLNDYPGHDDYYRLLTSWRGAVDDTPVLFMDEVAQNNLWLAYLPQAVGITLARLLGLRQLPLMMLARLMNLAFFLVCLGFAMKFMPFGKELLGLAALLPMTMEQVSSMSYDAFILGAAFLYTAYVLHLAFMADRVRVRDMVLVTALMAVLGPIKMVYIFLAFLMFLIPKEKFGSTKRYALCALGMVAVIALFYLVLQLGKLTEYVQETNTHLNYADAESYTLSFVLTHPANTVKVFFNTVRLLSGQWYGQMVGYSLGWLEIAMPEVVPYLFTGLMMFAVARPASEPVYWKGRQRALTVCVVAITICVTIFAMMVAYTPMGNPIILGVQGRYFLPVLPLALVMVRGKSFRREQKTGDGCLYAACLLNIWTVVNCMVCIMARVGEMHMTTNT